jgi:hypothetical protein
MGIIVLNSLNIQKLSDGLSAAPVKFLFVVSIHVNRYVNVKFVNDYYFSLFMI